MKTNVDFNSPQEEYTSKEINKENEIKNNSKINNRNINIEENDGKNEEDKNIEKNINKENDNDKNYNNIIIEKNNIENNEKKKKTDNINKIIKNVIEEEKNEDDPLITYIASNRKISDEEIKTSSTLIIEEIDGNLLKGKKIEINAGGMVDGRNKKNGFTIFGQKKVENSKNLNSEISVQKEMNINNNDIFIPDYELNYSNYLAYPYIFTIYYKKEDKSYYLRAYCGKGSDNKILFIKLNNEKKYILKRKELISAGVLFFKLHLSIIIA